MQSVSSRIWTRVALFISNDDNNYTTGTSTITPRTPPQLVINSIYALALLNLSDHSASHGPKILRCSSFSCLYFVLSNHPCPWCNDYRHWKWTRWYEFKSWTRPIAFHIALIPLGKVWIQLFSLQLWVNSRTDWVLQPWWGN